MTYPPQGFPPPPYGGPPPKKSRKVLWIVLSAVGALLVCCSGFAFFLWKMTLSPDSAPQQIKALAKDYKRAVDVGDGSRLDGVFCLEDAPDADSILRNDAKIAQGEIDVTSASTVNNVGAVVFTDAKGVAWTLYFRKEGGTWKVCPSAKDGFKAASTTTP